VVAGGDGTLSDIMNTVDPSIVLAYLPMGSGNAWRNTLGLPRSTQKAAQQVKHGKVRSIDLILVDEQRKGLLASVGFEGHALMEREKLLEQGVSGFDAYFRATAKSIFGGYKGEDATVEVENGSMRVRNALTLIVTKTPYYGYGLKVLPKAKLDDGLLHVLLISGQPVATISGIVTSLLGGNLFGEYVTCKAANITTDEQLHLQVDGTLVRKGTRFSFQVLPGALKIRY
jgi:diacylglycerol kinase family enzyme